MQVCAACYAFSKRIRVQIEEPTLPDLFDDLWRKSFIQGYLRVRQVRASILKLVNQKVTARNKKKSSRIESCYSENYSKNFSNLSIKGKRF